MTGQSGGTTRTCILPLPFASVNTRFTNAARLAARQHWNRVPFALPEKPTLGIIPSNGIAVLSTRCRLLPLPAGLFLYPALRSARSPLRPRSFVGDITAMAEDIILTPS